MSRRFLGVLPGLVALTGVLLAVFASTAGAVVQAKPFAVKRFAMFTSDAEHEVVEGPEHIHRVVSVPYAFTQAGGHPWGLTTELEFETEIIKVTGNEHAVAPTRNVKDVVVNLPPGLLGNPTVTHTCSSTVLLGSGEPCRSDTQVGEYHLHFAGGDSPIGGEEWTGPIVNLTPEKGQSAEFGLENAQKVTPVLTAHVVRTAKGYGLTVVSNGVPSTLAIVGVDLTFWGVPADPSHDPSRGLECDRQTATQDCGRAGGVPSGDPMAPFLTMPADCAAGPVNSTVQADSWQEPGVYREGPSPVLPAATGCNALGFDPSVGVSPNTLLADEPVELGVELEVPQALAPEANATPQVRDSVVTLPEGLSVNPGVVDGVQACDATGPEGIDIPTGLNGRGEPLAPGEMGPEGEELGLNGEPQLAAGHCPDASIVGTAKAFTPLLGAPVEGHVYLARPQCGGSGEPACTETDALDGKLYRLYLELGGKGALADAGVNLKVVGDTAANPATGQLTTVFADTPQLPFSKLQIKLNGGPRAPLANPAVCGPAVTTSRFTPWSAPGITPEGALVSGTSDATPSSSYGVEGCASPEPFAPGFSAGTVTPQAGQFSSFTMNLSRSDREQYVKGIQLHTPPGLLAMLSSVPLCPEAQANDPGVYGECTASKIGTARVASGAGSHPFEIEGNVYLTGPHDGAPFGLSIVTHAVAGPFNLGLVVVRARIDIDPTDSTARVTTDETGPYAVPQIVFGVPLRLKRVTVNIDRPGFMFNPTNCGAQQITASVSGSQDAVAGVSSPFAVGACKSLSFKPAFTASTSGRTSRADGADLDVKLSYPANAVGNEANIAMAKVELPKQLPSRLTTLQKACPAATFESNPSGCPAASIVGVVRAATPLLPVGLSGPVYFVSHGGEAFPSLIVVLQGDGVRVDLTGSTFISKKGITSSTFKTVPDVPVRTFELYLPEGKFSALAANGNLCKPITTTTVKKRVKLKRHGHVVHKTEKVKKTKPTTLVMPTEFVAQNGTVLKQNTQIRVTGCTKRRTHR